MVHLLNLMAETTYDGDLSPSAYIILILMVLIIVGGLSWCMSRAIKAASSESNNEEQYPDEV